MSNIDKLAQKELYTKVEKQAHSLRGNPREYQVVTGLCPVNVIEMHAQKILALLDELEAAEKRIAELESGSQAQKLVEAIIVAIENEQERLFDEDYLMDSKECIDVIREEVKRWNDSRAAGIRIKGE